MIDWKEKGEALAAAWAGRYTGALSLPGVILGLGPAALETQAGEAWPGEHNWGACTLRSLNAVEATCLKVASIYPTIARGHQEVEHRAMETLEAAGIPRPSGTIAGIDVPSATIHCDSRTVKDANGKSITIPHFVWFANFDNDVDGAAYYLHLLGQGARQVISDGGTPHDLASAMYRRGYFGGFHPHAIYVAKDGTEHDGNAENIAAYEALIQVWVTRIRVALRPDAPPTPPTLRRGAVGPDVVRLQTLLGGLATDGHFGPLTEHAVIDYQKGHGLLADGIVGRRTWESLEVP